MINIYKKRRQDWLNSTQGSFSPQSKEEIKKKQEISERQEQLLKKYWKSNFKALDSGLYSEEKTINLDTYDNNVEEKDIVVVPRSMGNPIVKLAESPQKRVRRGYKYKNGSIVLEDSDDEFKRNLLTKDYIIPKKPVSIEINTNSKHSLFEVVNDNKSEKKGNEFDSDKIQAQIQQKLALLNGGKASGIPLPFQSSSGKKQGASFNGEGDKSVAGEEQSMNEESNVSKNIELFPEPQSEMWFNIKNAGQVPLSFLSDWKCKAIDKVNIDFGVQYQPHEIFHKLFTIDMYALITQSIFDKQKRKQSRRNEMEEEIIPFSPYEIDAFIAFIFHFKALDKPNLISLVLKEQQMMERDRLNMLLTNFSIGMKEENSQFIYKDPVGKARAFLEMANSSFKVQVEPKEYLILNSKGIHGQDLRKNQLFFLKESRLLDAAINYILDLQFDKFPTKNDPNIAATILLTQGNQLDFYKGKAHKVIVSTNEGFETEAIRSLRKLLIGVITTVPLMNLELTHKQQIELSQRNKENHFFIFKGEICAVITPTSYAQVPLKRAYISNFIALQTQKDMENPKMQRVFLEIGNHDDYKDILMRHSTNLRWQLLSFIRLLDAIVHNTTVLYNMTTGREGTTLQKDEVCLSLMKHFLQKYTGHKSLQNKLLSTQIQQKDIRIHFCKELQGNKKIECIVCAIKSKNYCIQCSEKDQLQVGFCGAPACYEKHNALPAMLLNEQSNQANTSVSQTIKKKGPNDRQYDSCGESNPSFQSIGGQKFKFGATKNKPKDGYASESQFSLKSKLGNLDSIAGDLGSYSSIHPPGSQGAIYQIGDKPQGQTLGQLLFIQKQNKQNNAANQSASVQSIHFNEVSSPISKVPGFKGLGGGENKPEQISSSQSIPGISDIPNSNIGYRPTSLADKLARNNNLQQQQSQSQQQKLPQSQQQQQQQQIEEEINNNDPNNVVSSSPLNEKLSINDERYSNPKVRDLFFSASNNIQDKSGDKKNEQKSSKADNDLNSRENRKRLHYQFEENQEDVMSVLTQGEDPRKKRKIESTQEAPTGKWNGGHANRQLNNEKRQKLKEEEQQQLQKEREREREKDKHDRINNQPKNSQKIEQEEQNKQNTNFNKPLTAANNNNLNKDNNKPADDINIKIDDTHDNNNMNPPTKDAQPISVNATNQINTEDNDKNKHSIQIESQMKQIQKNNNNPDTQQSKNSQDKNGPQSIVKEAENRNSSGNNNKENAKPIQSITQIQTNQKTMYQKQNIENKDNKNVANKENNEKNNLNEVYSSLNENINQVKPISNNNNLAAEQVQENSSSGNKRNYFYSYSQDVESSSVSPSYDDQIRMNMEQKKKAKRNKMIESMVEEQSQKPHQEEDEYYKLFDAPNQPQNNLPNTSINPFGGKDTGIDSPKLSPIKKVGGSSGAEKHVILEKVENSQAQNLNPSHEQQKQQQQSNSQPDQQAGIPGGFKHPTKPARQIIKSFLSKQSAPPSQ